MVVGRGCGVRIDLSRGTGQGDRRGPDKGERPKPKLKKVLPEVWKLVKPRRALLAGSFVLMVINRARRLCCRSRSSRWSNKVMTQGQMSLLPKIIVDGGGRDDCCRALTSYALTQMLSKGGQRLISELRTQVQEHIGRLPVAFYDENRTGTLVARIMTDVEGVRNLVGTGVVDFVGGILVGGDRVRVC